MFYSRTTNDKVNKLYERALRLISDNYVSTFEDLLEKGNSFTARHFNIETLCIELYKVFIGRSQRIFSDSFERKNINHNLRSQPDFVISQIKTVYKGSNSIRYCGPIIWSLMPDLCRCSICKNYYYY